MEKKHYLMMLSFILITFQRHVVLNNVGIFRLLKYMDSIP